MVYIDGLDKLRSGCPIHAQREWDVRANKLTRNTDPTHRSSRWMGHPVYGLSRR